LKGRNVVQETHPREQGAQLNIVLALDVTSVTVDVYALT